MTNETQATELQEYQVQDLVDDAVATDTFDAYVYEYKQGGRTIQGLSARGVEHIGKRHGISIIEHKFEETEVDGLGKGILCTAEAMLKIVRPFEKETLPDGTVIEREGYEEVITAPGANFAPYVAYGKPDDFCHQKALTKAMRNARLQLIEASYQKLAIKELLALKKPQAAPIPANTSRKANGTAQQRTANQNAKDPRGQAEQMAFAAYNNKATALEKLGITKELFWEGVKAFFKVKSREQMTAVQYSQLCDALNEKDFAQWIRDLAPKKTETKTAETEKEADPQF